MAYHPGVGRYTLDGIPSRWCGQSYLDPLEITRLRVFQFRAAIRLAERDVTLSRPSRIEPNAPAVLVPTCGITSSDDEDDVVLFHPQDFQFSLLSLFRIRLIRLSAHSLINSPLFIAISLFAFTLTRVRPFLINLL